MSINPSDALVSKIRIYTPSDEGHIEAIEFFDINGISILKAGRNFKNEKEVLLEEGERLIGIRSKLLDNGTRKGAVHCNMTLIIGRMM